MPTIKIVAAILDTQRLTLYKEDGNKIEIPQGDPRVQLIIDQATTPLSTVGFVEIDIQNLHPEETNDFRNFEDQTKGKVQFFRVAKRFLKNIFSSDEVIEQDDKNYGTHKYVAPISLGSIPNKPTIEEATKEIMANAQPVNDPKFSTKDTLEEEHTMIATVKDTKSGKSKIVPGVENIQPQLRAAANLGSTEGVTKFLERIAAVIDDRGHTVDELLRFMSKGDLPIADDGSIIAYKVLQSRGNEGKFVDVHSKNVLQAVGSYVTQVGTNADRRVDCATGLHIARRGYLRSFSGDIIVLVKIAPEDVIAVPIGEPDKMRAKGYHILSVIPRDQHDLLRANKPLASEEAKKLLGMAIRGEHIGIIEDVVIGGPKGTNLKITQREEANRRQPKMTEKHKPAEPIETDLKEKQSGAPVVSPKTVSATALTEKTTSGTARQLFVDGKYKDLITFKKAKKKSWSGLGFTDAEANKIMGLTPAPATSAPKVAPKSPPKPATKAPEKAPVKAAPKKATKASVAPVVASKGSKKGAGKAPSKKTEPAPVAKAPAKPKAVPVISEKDIHNRIKDMTRPQRAKHLLGLIEDNSNNIETQRNAYKILIEVKRAAKVGWMQLGVPNFEAIQNKFEK